MSADRARRHRGGEPGSFAVSKHCGGGGRGDGRPGRDRGGRGFGSAPGADGTGQGRRELRGTRGGAEEDFDLSLPGDWEVNPTLLHLLGVDHDVHIGADTLFGALDDDADPPNAAADSRTTALRRAIDPAEDTAPLGRTKAELLTTMSEQLGLVLKQLTDLAAAGAAAPPAPRRAPSAERRAAPRWGWLARTPEGGGSPWRSR